MQSRVAVVALTGSIFIACKAGQQGPVGPAGLSVGDGGTATTCQAGTAFCDSNLSLSVYGYTNGAYDSTKSCSVWTGTVTWTADVPSWSVTINATCSPPNGVVVSATFNGDV